MKDINHDGFGPERRHSKKTRLTATDIHLKLTARQRKAYNIVNLVKLGDVIYRKRIEALIAAYKPLGADETFDTAQLRKRFREDKGIYEKECVPIIEQLHAHTVAQEIYFKYSDQDSITVELIDEICGGDLRCIELATQELLEGKFMRPAINGRHQWIKPSVMKLSDTMFGQGLLCDWAQSFFPRGKVTSEGRIISQTITALLGTRGQNALLNHLDLAAQSNHPIRVALRKLEQESKDRSSQRQDPNNVGVIVLFARKPAHLQRTADAHLRHVLNEPDPLHFPRVLEYFFDETALETLVTEVFPDLMSKLRETVESVESEPAENVTRNGDEPYFVTLLFQKINQPKNANP